MRRLTSTMAVAGWMAPKNSPCARPIFSQRDMSVTNILVLTTSSRCAPSSSKAAAIRRIASRLFRRIIAPNSSSVQERSCRTGNRDESVYSDGPRITDDWTECAASAGTVFRIQSPCTSRMSGTGRQPSNDCAMESQLNRCAVVRYLPESCASTPTKLTPTPMRLPPRSRSTSIQELSRSGDPCIALIEVRQPIDQRLRLLSRNALRGCPQEGHCPGQTPRSGRWLARVSGSSPLRSAPRWRSPKRSYGSAMADG